MAPPDVARGARTRVSQIVLSIIIMTKKIVKVNKNKKISSHELRKNNSKKESKKTKMVLGIISTIILISILLGKEFIALVGGFIFTATLITCIFLMPMFCIYKFIKARNDVHYKKIFTLITLFIALQVLFLYLDIVLTPITLLFNGIFFLPIYIIYQSIKQNKEDLKKTEKIKERTNTSS